MTERDVQETGVAKPIEKTTSFENLALLYQGLLTAIVRVQSRRQQIADGASFRRRMIGVLKDVERDALAAGYEGSDIREAHFAVIAFLDQVVLNSNDPISVEWKRRILQEEFFGETNAGVVFFEKLEQFRSRRDSAHLADILEVYLLCLLLGFEGRYSGGLRGELESITERLRRRIDDIRGRSSQLSPNGGLPAEVAVGAIAPPERANLFRLVTIGVVIFTIIFYFALNWHLYLTSAQVRSKLF